MKGNGMENDKEHHANKNGDKSEKANAYENENEK